MSPIVPTLGRVVLYCLTAVEAVAINERRRTDPFAHGNTVKEGDIFPADVVRVWGDQPDSYVTLLVKLDGNELHWVPLTQVSDGPVPGKFHWTPYQLGKAARTLAAEAKASE